MSLDVYLTIEGSEIKRSSGIFIREDGQCKEISKAEWDVKFPGRKPIIAQVFNDSGEVYHANVTHNLNRMASEAGIYAYVWRPDENGIEKAHQLIEPLRKGIALLESDPERFKRLNPSNGWGSYLDFVPWLKRYLAACEQNPEASVSVSR